MDKTTSYIELPAFKVQQPLGNFYVIKISADQLLSISFSEPMEYVDESGKVRGSQRPKDIKRLKEIAKYIDSVEMAFPNSIILAANYTVQGTLSKDESERWKIVEENTSDICKIIIPKKAKLAAVIDGQHRLNAFEYVTNPERFSKLQLICSVYFDLPNSYQAFLFATINSNQKKVNRSLALEQFGYNVDEEPEKAWTPEKFAVFLSRKLNIDKSKSPFYKHIKVAPLHPENLFKDGMGDSWVVSTATVVDGIVSLISSNAKRDRIEMQQSGILSGRHREMLDKILDYSPLRKLFIECKDQSIYNTILNYFNVVNNLLWGKASEKSYITKTIGVQALFDILKLIIKKEGTDNLEQIDFKKYIFKVSHVDFSDKFFQASGIGRSRIRNIIGIATNLFEREKVNKGDLPNFENLLSSKPSIEEHDKLIWEEAAKALINVLEKAEWNYIKKTVSLYLESDYEKPIIFSDFSTFFNKLINIVEEALVAYLPADDENSEKLREKFDEEDLVNSYLEEYKDNLKRLGWP